MVKTSVKIGVEIDGAQHFGFNSRWHKDKSDFEAQVRRDLRKDELCQEQGISVIHHDARKGVVAPLLRKQVATAVKTGALPGNQSKKKNPKEKTEWEKQAREWNRQYRKELYQKMKQQRKKQRES